MANFSIYSLISILIKASSESKISLAITFASWVLPTPVCPKNMNEPIGLFGSFSPALFLWIDLAILLTASSCPITFPLMVSGNSASFLPSVLAILLTGMPVIIATTSATCCSVTTILLFLESSSHFSWAIANSFSIFFSSSLHAAASSYFCRLTALLFLSLISSSCFSSSRISSGTSILVICTREPASSRASMALSGKNLSVIYLLVSFTQASIASGV